ncbi:MAG TPA: hypothetical protein PLI43_02170 [Albidovulum sp.]|uniref:hypothetical protein n=1 Tax=Albidovulum sp. TaxID=1872424 RepID=UPI002C7BD752|nr:hypothetical protein [Albidovulum sp.]
MRTADEGLAVVLCGDRGAEKLVIDPAIGAPVKKPPAGAGERCGPGYRASAGHRTAIRRLALLAGIAFDTLVLAGLPFLRRAKC